MLYEYGDVFKKSMDALCITTNGYVAAGKAVMGRGIALKIQEYCPKIKVDLGRRIIREGADKVHLVYDNKDDVSILAFPVKPDSTICNDSKSNIVKHARGKFKAGGVVPGFYAVADLDIIKASAKQLIQMADANPEWKRIMLPYPGCGAGELSWKRDVEPVLSVLLDDRFIVVTFTKPKETNDDLHIFLSGSMGVSLLPSEAHDDINSMIALGAVFLVGDCTGADSVFQSYLKNIKYHKVVVCHMGKKPRNLLSKYFATECCDQFANGESGRAWFTVKDKKMSDFADAGICLWDGRSVGTKRNIDSMQAAGKEVQVYKV